MIFMLQKQKSVISCDLNLNGQTRDLILCMFIFCNGFSDNVSNIKYSFSSGQFNKILCHMTLSVYVLPEHHKG